jgi:hypothetical protein
VTSYVTKIIKAEDAPLGVPLWLEDSLRLAEQIAV